MNLPATITHYQPLPAGIFVADGVFPACFYQAPVEMRWRPSDLAYRMEVLINRYSVVRHMEGKCPTTVGEFLKSYDEVIGHMGELHQEVFHYIKQNGYTHDDIRGVPSTKPPASDGQRGASYHQWRQ